MWLTWVTMFTQSLLMNAWLTICLYRQGEGLPVHAVRQLQIGGISLSLLSSRWILHPCLPWSLTPIINYTRRQTNGTRANYPAASHITGTNNEVEDGQRSHQIYHSGGCQGHRPLDPKWPNLAPWPSIPSHLLRSVFCMPTVIACYPLGYSPKSRQWNSLQKPPSC